MAPREFMGNRRLDGALLDQWVEVGWLVPHPDAAGGERFSDVDLARACLIGDLQDLGVGDDSIPIILDLVDQLHGLRRLVRGLLLALNEQRREQDRR